jgi:hypothetical protein
MHNSRDDFVVRTYVEDNDGGEQSVFVVGITFCGSDCVS